MRPRRLSAVAISALLAISALPLFAGPVAAIPVGDEAAFRAAWENGSVTLITLTANITFTCVPPPFQRDSIEAIVIDGAGFTLANTGAACTGAALDSEGSGAVTLRNLTLTGTSLSGDGLLSSGEVVVENSSITGHGDDAVDTDGAGDEDDGDITVSGSTFSGNLGNGISALGNVTVSGSTVTNNGGSGVVGFDVTVTGSTVAANAEFGVWSNGGQAALTNSTILGNGAVGIVGYAISARHVTISGNGLNIESWDPLDTRPTPPTLRLFATVLIDPTGGQNCLEETVIDDGFNFIDDTSCGSIPASTADPQLGALGNNGGATQTRLPADLSPLVDAIPSLSCAAGVTTDQRAVSRPQGSGCDIGSVELVPPAASITDVSVTEGNSGTVDAVFTVTLSRSTTRTVTIAFATANGTATAPADYESTSGTLTFVPGDVSETITVLVIGETIDEANDTFLANLSAPTNATLADAQGVGNILDDDGPSAGLLPDTATIGHDGLGGLPAAGLILAVVSVSALRARRRTANGGR